ncbi:extracellular metalloproteinase MEP [Ceratobasidium sp. AG-Ba]|nr:extracellular metalloproteinase MEP [Ceratobasidium sp. AG-Ba]
MKPLPIAALLALFLSPTTGHSTRKSLRFGPRPITRFVTQPHSTSAAASAHPFDVARAFLHSYIDSEYFIRNDSYTDGNTGITHVYVRQLINGFEVADGNINLNVRDGQILSFGDSFFRGSPQSISSRPMMSHASYCGGLAHVSEAAAQTNTQVTFSDKTRARDEAYMRVCAQPLAAVKAAIARDSCSTCDELRRAALYFMIAAHPDELVVDALANEFEAVRHGIHVTHELDQDLRASFLVSGLPGALSPVKARVVYLQIPTESGNTKLHATWRLEIEMADNWYEAYMSVNEPSVIVSVIDWAADSPTPRLDGHLNALEAKIGMGPPGAHSKTGSYKVWKWGINDPESGERTVESRLYDRLASPFGWHTVSRGNNPEGSPKWVASDTYLNFTTTWGNNVFAQENWEGGQNWIGNRRPEGGKSLNFEFEYGVKDGIEKDPKEYADLSVTQLFYTTNMFHDLFYRYGFDEIAGNFQQDNYGRGGRDHDAIIANVQDGSYYNTASFMTPPDGQNPRCRLYIWNTATPYRDGSLDSGSVIHELSHGLSARLVGGPSNSGCLGWGESGGLGEGWGDFLALIIRSTSQEANADELTIGSWITNSTNGFNHSPYSTNATVNPSTYETLNEVEFRNLHGVGEVWAEILWVVLQEMIKVHGRSPTLFPPQQLEDGTTPIGDFYRPSQPRKPLVPKHGNTLMVQLVVSSMKLVPCRPSIFDSRDAIIEADRVLTGGENLCLLWKAFSSRGLGRDAKLHGGGPWDMGKHTNGYQIPEECA